MIVYAAPNRSHHFFYAEALERAGLLHRFVAGYPRLGGKFRIDVPEAKIVHRDHLQIAYLVGLRFHMPFAVTARLDEASKQWMMAGARRALEGARGFMFYNGAGGGAMDAARARGLTTVCEVVNSHVGEQDAILRGEAERLGVNLPRPHKPEFERRQREYRDADYILGPSEFVLDSFRRRGVSDGRLLKVRYGCNPRHVREGPRVDAPASRFRLLYVGSVHLRKGLRYLIEAFRGLSGQTGWELRIVGPRAEPSGLAGMTMPPGVSFAGPLSGEALVAEYEAADLFVQPSLEEGLSLVIGEALAAGLPVVATENSGARDLMGEGNEAGTIVPIRDPEALRLAIQAYRDDPEQWKRAAEAAWKLARQDRGWSLCGEELAEVCRSILNVA